MSRCLRCDAGPEWIEGNVKDEPAARPDRAAVVAALESYDNAHDEGSFREINAKRAALLALIFPEEP